MRKAGPEPGNAGGLQVLEKARKQMAQESPETPEGMKLCQHLDLGTTKVWDREI